MRIRCKISDMAWFKGVDTFNDEKAALLSVVDKTAAAIFRSQVYYDVYTLERTHKADAVQHLHDQMVELYQCILKLLAKSSDLASNTAVQFCRAIFETQKNIGLALKSREAGADPSGRS